MPTVNLSPLFNDAQLDSSGNPYSGAKLFTYAAGSSTKQNTYTTSAGSVAQANPIVLNARGEPASPIWLTDGSSYKFVLAGPSDSDPPASPIRTIDNISGINDVAATAQSEWVASGVTPTYVSSSSFTLAGDQSTEFHVGRRLKITDGAGTDYAAISKSTFSVDTTTVTIDATTLTTPVSAVSLGINSAANTSLPLADTSIIAPHSPLAPHENLAVATASVSTATITADKVVVVNTNGRKAVLSTVSLTVNIASAGANGLDTGAEASGTWYYLWVIWNGATVAGLISTSATAPTLPSGYTHQGLVGAVRNDSGSNFIGMNQRGTHVSAVQGAVLTNGSATSVTSVALTSSVPPNVWRALIYTDVLALTTTPVYGSIFSDSAGTILANRTGAVHTTDAAQTVYAVALVLLRTSQMLWYSVNNADCDLDIDVIGYAWA